MDCTTISVEVQQRDLGTVSPIAWHHEALRPRLGRFGLRRSAPLWFPPGMVPPQLPSEPENAGCGDGQRERKAAQSAALQSGPSGPQSGDTRPYPSCGLLSNGIMFLREVMLPQHHAPRWAIQMV